jgi:type III pantothenate kinase
MLLAIDIGNTNTVFALFKGDALAYSWRCTTIRGRSADEYASFLNELFSLEKISWNAVSDIIIGSVVPEADFHIKGFCKKYLKKEALMVTANIVGIPIDMPKPEEVGADRLINAVAVIEDYKIPAIVIDFGTATTFDVIDEKGRYIGGAIAPGINLSVEALHQAAAKLPSIEIKKPARAIGKTTIEAMQSGVYLGYIGLIENIVKDIATEIGSKPFVLATGGLAPLFAGSTDVIEAVDDTLTLKGLLKIYKRQRA